MYCFIMACFFEVSVFCLYVRSGIGCLVELGRSSMGDVRSLTFFGWVVGVRWRWSDELVRVRELQKSMGLGMVRAGIVGRHGCMDA